MVSLHRRDLHSVTTEEPPCDYAGIPAGLVSCLDLRYGLSASIAANLSGEDCSGTLIDGTWIIDGASFAIYSTVTGDLIAEGEFLSPTLMTGTYARDSETTWYAVRL